MLHFILDIRVILSQPSTLLPWFKHLGRQMLISASYWQQLLACRLIPLGKVVFLLLGGHPKSGNFQVVIKRSKQKMPGKLHSFFLLMLFFPFKRVAPPKKQVSPPTLDLLGFTRPGRKSWWLKLSVKSAKECLMKCHESYRKVPWPKWIQKKEGIVGAVWGAVFIFFVTHEFSLFVCLTTCYKVVCSPLFWRRFPIGPLLF